MGRHAKRQSLKEKLMAPASGSAINAGQAFVGGASIIGIGGLCFYGLGMSNEKGALEKSITWSPVVKQRIRDTYLYFGGGLAVTAAAAVTAARSPMVMNFMMQ